MPSGYMTLTKHQTDARNALHLTRARRYNSFKIFYIIFTPFIYVIKKYSNGPIDAIRSCIASIISNFDYDMTRQGITDRSTQERLGKILGNLN